MKRMYFCDPLKNETCGKQACFVHGGGCYMTSKKECQQEYDIPRRQALRCLEDVLDFCRRGEEYEDTLKGGEENGTQE